MIINENKTKYIFKTQITNFYCKNYEKYDLKQAYINNEYVF